MEKRILKELILSVVIVLVLLVILMTFRTYFHEMVHERIFWKDGCQNVTVYVRPFTNGKTWCNDDGYVSSEWADTMHIQNEIKTYNESTTFVLVFCILAWQIINGGTRWE